MAVVLFLGEPLLTAIPKQLVKDAIQYFGCKIGLAVMAKQSVIIIMFFLELNHDILTIWYQIDQCHFAYTAETQTSIFSTSHRLQINGRKAFHRTFFYILQ